MIATYTGANSDTGIKDKEISTTDKLQKIVLSVQFRLPTLISKLGRKTLDGLVYLKAFVVDIVYIRLSVNG